MTTTEVSNVTGPKLSTVENIINLLNKKLDVRRLQYVSVCRRSDEKPYVLIQYCGFGYKVGLNEQGGVRVTPSGETALHAQRAGFVYNRLVENWRND